MHDIQNIILNENEEINANSRKTIHDQLFISELYCSKG